MTAAAGRADLDATTRLATVPANEPVFIIRAQDAASADAVRAWASIAHGLGAPVAVLEQALQQADLMAGWPSKKVPDVGHLTTDQVKQLEYQHTRRSWSARTDCGDTSIMLAEERAVAGAFGRFRPSLDALFAGMTRQDDGSWIWRAPPGRETGQPIEAADPLEGLRRFLVVSGWRAETPAAPEDPRAWAPPAAEADHGEQGQNDG